MLLDQVAVPKTFLLWKQSSRALAHIIDSGDACFREQAKLVRAESAPSLLPALESALASFDSFFLLHIEKKEAYRSTFAFFGRANFDRVGRHGQC